MVCKYTLYKFYIRNYKDNNEKKIVLYTKL